MRKTVFVAVLVLLMAFFVVSASAEKAEMYNGNVMYISDEKSDSVSLMAGDNSDEVTFVDEFVAGGVRYSVDDNGIVYVTGYTMDIPSDVTIPHTLADGRKVVHIYEGALYNCDLIKNLVISEGVKTIGEGAVSGCSGLVKVTIPASVEYIANDAFSMTTSLKKFVVAAGNACYKEDVALISKDGLLIQYPLANDALSYTIPEGVTDITSYSFAECANLQSVTVASTTKTIEEAAFLTCKALQNIDLKNVEYVMYDAFSECAALKSVAFSNELSMVEPGAFTGCTALESITVEGKSVGGYYTVDGVLYQIEPETEATLLFMYPPAKADKVFVVSDDVDSINTNAFWQANKVEKIVLGKNVKRLENGAITSCAKLTEFVFNDKLEYIGNLSFQTNISLETITIGKGVKVIENSAFSNCEALKSVYIPASVEKIGDNVFEGCDSIERVEVESGNSFYSSVDGVLYSESGSKLMFYPVKKTSTVFNVPANVTKIAYSAFSGNKYITRFTVDSGNTGYVAIDGVLFTVDNILHTYPVANEAVSYTMPESTTSIAPYAFKACSLEKINFNSGLKSIGQSAFSNSKKLAEVYLPEGLQTIDGMAFFNCKSLIVVTLPSTLTSMKNQVFDYNDNLDYIVFRGQNPPVGQYGYCLDGTAEHCSALRYVYVPVGTQVEYKKVLSEHNALYPGAMVVEGEKISLDDTKVMADSLPETVTSSDYAEVTRVKEAFIRLTYSEKQQMSDSDIKKIDDAVNDSNDNISVSFDVADNDDTNNTNIGYKDINVYGMYTASGVESGVSALRVIPNPVTEDAIAEFKVEYTVNEVSKQPVAPIVFEIPISQELNDKKIEIQHFNSAGALVETIVPVVEGDKLIFRAYSFSTFRVCVLSPQNPGDPDDPTDPDDPNGPTDPDEPGDPDEPTDPDEPGDPDEPTDPDDPNGPTDPDEPGDPDDPTDPDEPDDEDVAEILVTMADSQCVIVDSNKDIFDAFLVIVGYDINGNIVETVLYNYDMYADYIMEFYLSNSFNTIRVFLWNSYNLKPVGSIKYE